MLSDFLRYLSYALGPIGGVYRAVGNVKKVLPSLDSNKGFAENLLSFVGSSLGSTAAQDIYNKYTGAGLTSAEKESIEQQRYLRQTTYQDQVQSMQDAGLNPAMMYGSGTSASTPSLSLPSQQGVSFSDLMQIALLPAQLKNLQADVNVKEAQAANLSSSADLNEQLRLFNEEINPLRIEAQQVSNNLGRTTERKINAECDKIAEEMNKIAAETETEVTKQLYNIAAANLADAQARQIVQMLPYSIELTKAQTQQAKALARLNFVQAAYQNKLLSEGFVDALISSKESDAAMQAVKERIKTGKAFQLDEDSTLAKVWNAFTEASGLSRGVQVIDYILDKINVFAPLVSKGAGVTAAAASSVHDPFGYMAGE